MKQHPFYKYLAISLAVCSGGAFVAALSQSAVNAMKAADSLPQTDTDCSAHNAEVVLQQKCADCHAAGANYNKTLNFLCGGLMKEHVENAQKAYIIGGDPQRRRPLLDELKMARVLSTRKMPPAPYSAVHFGSALTPRDIEVLHRHFGDKRLAQFEYIAPHQKEDGKDAKIQLGHILFFDGRLSSSNEISCASCHDLCQGGCDGNAKSKGVPGNDGLAQLGGVNAPTVYNAASNIRQFWDGRAADLKEQAGGPPLNPVEMGYSEPADWEKIADKLRQDPDLTALFALVYGDKGICAETITDAIACFEESLVTPDSAFDHYLQGDMQALSEEEKDGMRVFVSYGCVSCHAGATLGGQSFENINSFAPLRKLTAGDEEDLAHGREDYSRKEQDRDMFRVPNLRNVALTAPYFHNGSIDKLEDAVRIMFLSQVGSKAHPDKVKALCAFLRAQTGEYKGIPLDKLQAEDVRPESFKASDFQEKNFDTKEEQAPAAEPAPCAEAPATEGSSNPCEAPEGETSETNAQ